MGKKNTGNRNTGHWNTGSRNTGHFNNGYWNTGNCNAGSRNTGNCNTGNWNAGNWNAGNCNTGHWNTGDCNTGNWNTGNRNTGYCNTVTPEQILVFNKPCNFEDWENADKPGWMYAISLTTWVDESEMSDKEKEAYPSYATTGGYLKVATSYQQAALEAWENTTIEDRSKTLELPNYDREVFREIFGFYADIDIQSCVGKVVEIDGKKYKLTEVK